MTADTESHVAVVGLTSGAIYRRLETLPSPFSIERAGRAAVVAHTVSGRVTVLERTARVAPSCHDACLG